MGKTCRGIRANWTSEMMDEAIRLLRQGKSQRYVEQVSGIPRSTLRDHLKSGITVRQLGRRPVLTQIQENDLSGRIIKLSTMGVPLTPKSVRRSVFSYCKKNEVPNKFNDNDEMAGYSWYKAFMRRRPELSKRKSQAMNWARAQKLNPFIVKDYFGKLSTTMDQLNVKNAPHKIFNLDEKGCRLTLHHSQSVLAAKGSKRVHLISNEHAENVTVVACVSASGQTIPPMIIYKGQRKQDTFSDNLPPGSVVEMANKGSMTKEIFLKWLQHFDKFKPAGAVLLILDGASCHMDVDIAELAQSFDVTILCLPSNTTHELQPLDKAVFRSFEHFWDSELLKYWEQNPSANRRLTKSHFGKVFLPVWQKALTMSTIQNGFKSTGIYPFDPDVIPQFAYAPSMLTNKEPEFSDEDDLPLSSFVNKTIQTDSTRSSKPSCSSWGGSQSSQNHAPTPGCSKWIDRSDERSMGHTSDTIQTKPAESLYNKNTGGQNEKIKILNITVIKPKTDQSTTKTASDTCAFSTIIRTPDFTVTKKSAIPRKKAINYKAQVLKRDLFDKRSAISKQVKHQKSTLEEEQEKESWLCSICNEDIQRDMRHCSKCNNWVHEDCVGLTEEDLEEFQCPDCTP